MSKPAVILPYYISDQSGNSDASADIVGRWIKIDGCDNLGFQAVWGIGVTGTFLFEVSNDQKLNETQTQVPDGRLGPTPLTLPTSMTGADAIPAGTAGTFYFGFNQIEALWMRMSFIADGGGSSGTLQVGASGKGV